MTATTTPPRSLPGLPDENDASADRQAAKDARHHDASQEEGENRPSADDPIPDQGPHETRREEAVVQALVGSQHRGRFSYLRRGSERSTPERCAPEEHFQHQEIDVHGRDHADENGRDRAHGDRLGHIELAYQHTCRESLVL